MDSHGLATKSTLNAMDDFMNVSDTFLLSMSNPMKFWLQNQGRWPHVVRTALDIHEIPPTEADSELSYSNSNDMTTKK